jgi:hypothetical protein
MERQSFLLRNNFEHELLAVVPDLDLAIEREGEAATCDQWGHVCSAAPDVACCGKSERARRSLADDLPND